MERYMEEYYEMVIDALAECIKNGSEKDSVLSEAQKQLEFAFDRMKVEGQPIEKISRLLEQIKTLRFDL